MSTINTKQQKQEGAILVVEDEIASQMVMRYILESQDYKVVIASNGKEALEMLDQENEFYSLIFMDTQMPILSGCDTARIIRDGSTFEHFKNYKTIPIIAFSGNIDTQSKEMAKDAGMNDYLTKPFLKTEVLAMVKKFI